MYLGKKLMKLMALGCAVVMVLAITGCGSSNTASSSASASSSSAASESSSSSESESTAASDDGKSSKLSDAEKEITEVIKFGQPISTDEYDFTLDSWGWEKGEEGGTWYYLPNKGTYADPAMNVLAIRGTYTNKRTETINLTGAASGFLYVNDEYQYRLNEASGFELAPLETIEMVLYAEIPDAMKDQFTSGQMLLLMSKDGHALSTSNSDVLYQLDF